MQGHILWSVQHKKYPKNMQAYIKEHMIVSDNTEHGV